MTERARKLLDKASRSIHAAETLLRGGDTEFASGRAYYAMFYTAEALLVEKGLRYSKHGGTHAGFGEHYAKTGIFDAKYHRWLLDAFDMRVNGDYGVEGGITLEDVSVAVKQAQEFLTAARKYLEEKP